MSDRATICIRQLRLEHHVARDSYSEKLFIGANGFSRNQLCSDYALTGSSAADDRLCETFGIDF